MQKKPLVLPVRTALGEYFYETSRNEIVVVNEQLLEYIEHVLSNDSEEILVSDDTKRQFDELQNNGYLSPGYVEDVLHPATAHVENLLNRGVERLSLQVTQQCNLRCKYCIYSEDSNFSQRSHSSNIMSLDIAKKAIMFYRRHAIDIEKPVIGFYGGEPLLAFPTIVKAVEYADDLFEGKNIAYNITTNATLLTDEIIDFLLSHDFKITFSLDGPKAVQDRNRVFRGGGGTYDLVIHNIRKVYEKTPDIADKLAISMVIQPETDYSELISLFSEPMIKEISLIPSIVEENSVPKKLSSDYVSDFNYESFLTLTEYFRDEKTRYSNPLQTSNVQGYDRNIRELKTTVLAPISAPGGPCVPGKLKMFIDCFGNIFPCEKVDESKNMQIGTIDDGFDIEQVKRLLNVGRLTPELCKNCWVFPFCGICARGSSEGGKLSASKRAESCEAAKLNAYRVIMEKILVFENQQHMRRLNHLWGGEFL